MATTEAGHAASRSYEDQDGCFHLNGAPFYLDEIGTSLTSPASRIVSGGATLTVTQALHDGKTISMPAAHAATLPAATGSGARYRFVQAVNATAVTITATGAHMFGAAWLVSDNSAAVLGYAAAGSTIITFDGSTKGGLKGAIVEIEDVATSILIVRVMSVATGTEATPFS